MLFCYGEHLSMSPPYRMTLNYKQDFDLAKEMHVLAVPALDGIPLPAGTEAS